MKLSNTVKNNKGAKKSGSFSAFFLHASEIEKKKVFTEAAKRANEDQRALLKRAKAGKVTK